MLPITDVIFDLDGTLVDSFPGIAQAACAACARIVPGRPVPDFRPFIGPPIRQIFRRALDESQETVVDALEAAFRAAYDGGAWRQSFLYPGAKEALAALRREDRRCYVLTNKPRLATQRILEHLAVADCFLEAVSPDCRQPPYGSKTEALMELGRRCALNPATILLVGDGPDDAAAAEAGGFRFAAAAFGYGAGSDQGHHPIHARLHTLADLPLLAARGFA